LPLLFYLLYFAPAWALPCALAALSAIAAYELLHGTGLVKNKLFLWLAVVLAMAMSLGLTYYHWAFFCMFLSLPALFVLALKSGGTVKFTDITVAIFAIYIIPFMFFLITEIFNSSDGIPFIILPFIAAFGTDTCAQLTGMAFGRHKLAPRVSPNKTVEGYIGGIIGCAALFMIYVPIADAIWGVKLSYLPMAVIALGGSVAAQFGDLCFSYIKREFGIKDFGKIMPGHGGILDRFDSLLFAGPAVYLLLNLLIIMG